MDFRKKTSERIVDDMGKSPNSSFLIKVELAKSPLSIFTTSESSGFGDRILTCKKA